MPKDLDRTITKYIFIVAGLILGLVYFDHVYKFFSLLMYAIWPLILGGIFAYVLNLIMVQYEKIYFPKSHNKWIDKTRRPIAILLAILTVVAVIALVIGLVIPQLISVVGQLIESIPVASRAIQEWFEGLKTMPPQVEQLLDQFDFNWNTIVNNTIVFINRSAKNVIGSTVTALSGAASSIINVAIALMISIYILFAKERLSKSFRTLLYTYVKPKYVDEFMIFMKDVDYSFRNFVVGQAIEAVILAVMIIVGMAILRLPYAMMIGILTGVTGFVPILGAYLSAAVGFFLILAVDVQKAFVFVLAIIVIQQIEGNVVYPRIVGSTMGVPSLWVLVAVVIGGRLMGVTGMILAVPMVSVIFAVLERSMKKRQAQQLMDPSKTTSSLD